jgi:hypothetical protein
MLTSFWTKMILDQSDILLKIEEKLKEKFNLTFGYNKKYREFYVSIDYLSIARKTYKKKIQRKYAAEQLLKRRKIM